MGCQRQSFGHKREKAPIAADRDPYPVTWLALKHFIIGMVPPMNRILLFLTVALGLFASQATAQMAKAHGKLYTRVEAGAIEIAVVIDIDRDYHLYHHDLGAPDAIGKPLKATLAGDVESFEELVWPEPHKYIQAGLGEDGGDTFILGHEDELVLYGRASLKEGEDEATVTIKLSGLTCEDGGACFPYDEKLKSSGVGKKSVWANYPTGAWAVPETVLDETPEQESAPATKPLGLSGFGAAAGASSSSSNRAHGKLYTREANGALELAIVIDIDEGLHLYHKDLGGKNATGRPLVVTLAGSGVEFDELAWPEPHRSVQEDYIDGGETYILDHQKQLTIYGTGQISGGADVSQVSVTLNGQTCEDNGTCFLYSESLASLGAGPADVWAGMGAQASAALLEDHNEDMAIAPSEEGEEKEEQSLWALIIAAIGGGIFALMMPCTYPMIPITISFFTKQAEARGGNVLPLALMYGAGIVLIFIVIGLAVGPVILEYATHPVTNIILGSMFVLFSAALFGAITLNPPSFMMNMAGKASMTGGLAGVFLMGMTLVLTSFTCTAPFVGSLLSLAAGDGEGGLLRMAIGMGVFGLTMAVPFTILSLVPGKIQSLPSSGEWMNTLKMSLGFIELAAALKFFSNADLVWGWGFLSRELFLLLWALIFFFGAMYLLGWIKIKGYSTSEIGPGRMLGALGFLLFGAYCWQGSNGHSMDNIMTAIIPPYSSAPVAAGGGGGAHAGAGEVAASRSMVVDDHEEARRVALQEEKLVLINFTGFT
jgi:thiol:disulfide interchange protein